MLQSMGSQRGRYNLVTEHQQSSLSKTNFEHEVYIPHLRGYHTNVKKLGRPRGMVWGGRREEGSGWGTHVYLWRIHLDIWQK